MEIKVIKKGEQINREELGEMAEMFGDRGFVKAVVDVRQEIMAVGGEFHSDGQTALMEQEGSSGEYTWGINLYPENAGEDFIEFDSMINLKPALGNRTRGVENEEIQDKIQEVVNVLVRE
jgi:hypothetical protein